MLYFCSGDMAEWSIAAVLKTVKPKGFGGSERLRGFESLCLRKAAKVAFIV